MTRYIGGFVATLAAVLLTACSNESETSGTASPVSTMTSETAAARPTLTAPELQPPAQEGQYVNKGRPAVVFDPCTWISDATVQEAGFDPATRKRGEDFVAEWTFLVCHFESELVNLSVMSGNVTLEQETEKNGSWQQPTTVNGREATIGKKPGRGDSCTVNIRTAVGVVFVDQRLNLQGRIQKTDPCTGVEQTAALIEQEIGEGN